jgi:hypothetical protein
MWDSSGPSGRRNRASESAFTAIDRRPPSFPARSGFLGGKARMAGDVLQVRDRAKYVTILMGLTFASLRQRRSQSDDCQVRRPTIGAKVIIAADSETARLWRSVVRAIFAQLMPKGGCRLNKNSTGIPGNVGTPGDHTLPLRSGRISLKGNVRAAAVGCDQELGISI